MSAEVREAQERDLPVLAGIEDASDALFVERFPDWEPGGSAAWMAPMREAEERAGLTRLGGRVAMVRQLP